MLFSKASKFLSFVAVFTVLALLASCAQFGGSAAKNKSRNSNITLLEDAELQTTTDYANAYEESVDSDAAESGDAYADQLNQGLFDDEETLGVVAVPETPMLVDADADAVVDNEFVVLEVADAEAVVVAEEVIAVPVITIEERFGPNPYLANPPLVDEQARIDFSAAMALLRDESAQPKDAEKALMAVVDNYPNLSGPAYNLAYYYYDLSNKDNASDATSDDANVKKALKYLDIAIARNSYNFDARNLKGKIYRDQSKFAAAEKEYLAIIDLWGGYLPAYKNLGIMFDLYMGDVKSAYTYYAQYNEYTNQQDRQVVGWAIVIERQLNADKARADAEAQALAAEQAAAEPASDTMNENADMATQGGVDAEDALPVADDAAEAEEL